MHTKGIHMFAKSQVLSTHTHSYSKTLNRLNIVSKGLLTANNQYDWSEEAHDTHTLDHDHEVGVCRCIGQYRQDEPRHQQRKTQVGEDEQGDLAHSRLEEYTRNVNIHTVVYLLI